MPLALLPTSLTDLVLRDTRVIIVGSELGRLTALSRLILGQPIGAPPIATLPTEIGLLSSLQGTNDTEAVLFW